MGIIRKMLQSFFGPLQAHGGPAAHPNVGMGMRRLPDPACAPRMPACWDDAKGWDEYHASLYPDGPFRLVRQWLIEAELVIAQNLAALIQQLRSHGQRTVW